MNKSTQSWRELNPTGLDPIPANKTGETSAKIPTPPRKNKRERKQTFRWIEVSSTQTRSNCVKQLKHVLLNVFWLQSIDWIEEGFPSTGVGTLKKRPTFQNLRGLTNYFVLYFTLYLLSFPLFLRCITHQDSDRTTLNATQSNRCDSMQPTAPFSRFSVDSIRREQTCRKLCQTASQLKIKRKKMNSFIFSFKLADEKNRSVSVIVGLIPWKFFRWVADINGRRVAQFSSIFHTLWSLSMDFFFVNSDINWSQPIQSFINYWGNRAGEEKGEREETQNPSILTMFVFTPSKWMDWCNQ